ncbi:unnamed protein product [Sphagnum tenellum]
MISSSSTASREQPPPRKRNPRAVYPSRRKGSSQAAAGRISGSDLNLVAALHEFIAAGDLPPEQVPSTQELARGGRQDIANAVRRRGFKVVARLLANPNFLRTSGANPSTQAKPSESQDQAGPVESHQGLLSQPNIAQLSQVAEKLKHESNNSYRNIHACETSSDDEGLGV